jgi:hypothetical protein
MSGFSDMGSTQPRHQLDREEALPARKAIVT